MRQENSRRLKPSDNEMTKGNFLGSLVILVLIYKYLRRAFPSLFGLRTMPENITIKNLGGLYEENGNQPKRNIRSYFS